MFLRLHGEAQVGPVEAMDEELGLALEQPLQISPRVATSAVAVSAIV